MLSSSSFPHLPFPKIVKGSANNPGNPTQKQQTIKNKENRATHSQKLLESSEKVLRTWQDRRSELSEEAQHIIPAGVSLLLQVEDTPDLRFLATTFGFEIVAEDEDGFVIVATEDVELSLFREKVSGFAEGAHGSGNAARLYELREEPERVQRILSDTLHEIWPILDDQGIYYADLGISCLGTFHIPDVPERKDSRDDDHHEERMQRWRQKRDNAYRALARTRDDRLRKLEEMVDTYHGKIVAVIEDGNPLKEDEPYETDYADSFTARVALTGQGLKDIVLNYRYVYDVQLPEEIAPTISDEDSIDIAEDRLVLHAPLAYSPAVCVIDSGIQEAHRLLTAAIDRPMSYCYIPDESVVDTADYCRGGGHGTRVAGAILYRNNIPTSGQHTLPFWIQNARVLDGHSNLHPDLFPPLMLANIVKRYLRSDRRTRLYNQSINEHTPYQNRHMSAWAAAMDALSFEEDILFIQSAGNLPQVCLIPDYAGDQRYWGVTEHLATNGVYPVYLRSDHCRIANPAQSMQALTVGSVVEARFVDNDYSSLGDVDQPASYSRTGLGIWDSIKPDIVEYGGDYVKDSGLPPLLSIRDGCAPELVRSTLFGGNERGRDDVGTSYAAPMVSHIAARLASELPDEPTLLYRALIAQSARWPTWAEADTEPMGVLQHIGYGIPSLTRATENSDYRVTLITNGRQEIKAGDAHIFQIPIPIAIRTAGRNHDIRVEITLSYAAAPRRTRRRLRGYMATRAEWVTSRRDETMDAFEGRIFKDQPEYESSRNSLKWFLQDRSTAGRLRGASRNNSTLQKDWTTLKSHQLPETFAVAVRGRRGWSEDPDSVARYALTVSFEAINNDIQVYEPIRAMIEAEVEAEYRQEVLSGISSQLELELPAS